MVSDSAALCDVAQVLESEKDNVKALYRRASARIDLCEFELAGSDLRTVLELDPNNRCVDVHSTAGCNAVQHAATQ
jgi:hypothetical protein